MRLTLCAVGRLRKGPERLLIDDYLDRFARTGRAVGLGPVEVVEVDDRKGDAAARLIRAVPEGARLCALDERGREMTSPEFAAMLAAWRDGGAGRAAFVIGGADGLACDLTERADAVLSLGAMVWPHMLARVMLAEQLYRAAAILAGTPYHRD